MKLTNYSLINQLVHPKVIEQSISSLDTELFSAEYYFGRLSDEKASKLVFPNDLIEMSCEGVPKECFTPQQLLVNAVRYRTDKQKELASGTGYRKLILSDKTYKNLSNYRAPKEVRIGVLRTLPNRSDIIQLTANKAIKYCKTDTFLSVYVTTMNGSLIDNYFFCIDLVTGLSYYHNYDGVTSDIKNSRLEDNLNIVDPGNNLLSYEDMVEKYYSQFIVCITYIELTDVTFEVCYSNSRRGHIMKGNDLKNELPYDVIQVNTNWNTTKIHIGDTFEVMGHWRLQPYGVGRAQYKYIFINTYEKTGIIKRRAGKVVNLK